MFFFGGIHSDVEKIFISLSYYSRIERLPSKNNNEWQSFKKMIEQYHKYRFPVLAIMTHLSYWDIWDIDTVEEYMKNVLFSCSGTLLNDAGEALIFMVKKQGESINQNIIKDIIYKISYVLNEDTCLYLNTIRDILLNKGIGREARDMLEEWVKKLPNLIEHYSISEEIKDDIRYYANQISGIMSTVWSDWSGLSDWKNYMQKEIIKNDVRNGFEAGRRMTDLYSYTNKT